MAPEDMDELLFTPFQVSLGADTRERLRRQFENYEYYDGKQHMNESGELVYANELERPVDLDYDPTRYATNYFKRIIVQKARWQMSGKHGIRVPRQQIDDPEEALLPDYTPSDAQTRANDLAENHEKLLYQLWNENKMRVNLIQAARDRLIAGRVVCKIVYNPRTGRLKWVFRPDTEFFPVFSDDDFEEMIAAHFIRQKLVEDGDDEIEAIQKQTFTLEGEGENLMCYVEEAVYATEDLSLIEQITPKSPMGIDFIPVVMFPVNDLLAELNGTSEVTALREQNDILNQMNEDAIDSLKFEMFNMTAIINAPDNISDQIRIAPGATIELKSTAGDGSSPNVKMLESGFKWKEAFKDQYMRVKGAMHEISGLPQVVPQEMNFGGLNTDTLQILFHDIITDTEEHWLAWEYGFEELHEKSVKYLQARVSEPNFKYDKQVVRAIKDYKTEMNFVLPLPDNRAELVDLLADEMANKLESQAGAMERLGVENVRAKKLEIQSELREQAAALDPYGAEAEALPEEEALPPDPGASITQKAEEMGLKKDDKGQWRDKNGEVMIRCSACGGTGTVISETGGITTCLNCQGDGLTQLRKR